MSVECDVAGGDVRSDIATVHQREVAGESSLFVRIPERGICGEIAGATALRTGEAPRRARSIGAQCGVGNGNANAQLFFDVGGKPLLQGDDLLILVSAWIDRSRRDALPILEGEESQHAQIAAALSEDNIPASRVSYKASHIFGVGMAVHKGDEVRRMRNHVRRHVVGGFRRYAEMPEHNDIIGDFGGIVDGALHGRVKLFASLSRDEIPRTVCSRWIQERRGLGRDQRRRRRHSNETDSHIPICHHDIGLKKQFARVVCGLPLQEIAARVLECAELKIAQHRRNAVVELMVAECRHIIAGGVHNLDDGPALVEATQGRALDIVSRIAEDDFFTLGDQTGLLR